MVELVEHSDTRTSFTGPSGQMKHVASTRNGRSGKWCTEGLTYRHLHEKVLKDACPGVMACQWCFFSALLGLHSFRKIRLSL
jgi:hypothetical protein